jgi:hypothetical protein
VSSSSSLEVPPLLLSLLASEANNGVKPQSQSETDENFTFSQLDKQNVLNVQLEKQKKDKRKASNIAKQLHANEDVGPN